MYNKHIRARIKASKEIIEECCNNINERSGDNAADIRRIKTAMMELEKYALAFAYVKQKYKTTD